MVYPIAAVTNNISGWAKSIRVWPFATSSTLRLITGCGKLVLSSYMASPVAAETYHFACTPRERFLSTPLMGFTSLSRCLGR